MKEKILADGEVASITTTIILFTGTIVDWFDDHSKAVVAMCAVVSAIGGIIFGILRHNAIKRQGRRKDDV